MDIKLNKNVKALIFDKDGTLFDFQKTWAPWAKVSIESLSDGKAEVEIGLAEAFGFDLQAVRFLPHSRVVACTAEETFSIARAQVPWLSETEVRARMNMSIKEMQHVPVGDVSACLARLSDLGLKCAIVTNDSEDNARRQLGDMQLEQWFDPIIGYDSGFGGKPAPDGCLAAARLLGVAPKNALMVGDSTHDIRAGRDAGMRTVGVLTGAATRADLTPHADIVFDDIHEIYPWISGS